MLKNNRNVKFKNILQKTFALINIMQIITVALI